MFVGVTSGYFMIMVWRKNEYVATLVYVLTTTPVSVGGTLVLSIVSMVRAIFHGGYPPPTNLCVHPSSQGPGEPIPARRILPLRMIVPLLRTGNRVL